MLKAAGRWNKTWTEKWSLQLTKLRLLPLTLTRAVSVDCWGKASLEWVEECWGVEEADVA